MRPLFSGPEVVTAGVLEPYSGRMRPCWPYDDAVTYLLDWGDGSTFGFHSPDYEVRFLCP
ncbi:MAG TPA: hypothetical protein VEY88_18780 [Archangium sp.]|nr:hypothetical protein [Archangium sp.]